MWRKVTVVVIAGNADGSCGDSAGCWQQPSRRHTQTAVEGTVRVALMVVVVEAVALMLVDGDSEVDGGSSSDDAGGWRR